MVEIPDTLVAGSYRLVKENDRLRAVRDQLLAGLHEIKSQMHNLPRSATADYVERTARDLIAKAKEQQP